MKNTIDHQIPIYYAQQSRITDPGEFKDNLLTSLDVSQLCDFINNLVLIDFLVTMNIISVPQLHKTDVNVRNVEEKINILLARNESPLVEPRSNDEKILGNCRDTSILLCSMLRQNGIAARLRSGFATFFDPEKRFDHWLCEYWDKEMSRWVKVDSWMYQIRYHQDILPPMLQAGLVNLPYNPLDVEDKYFVSGAQAWLKCQSQGEDPNNYGTYGDLQGLWFIRDNMLRDLLCLNKTEILPWDCKGLMSGERGELIDQDKETLNYVANLLINTDNNFDKIREYYKTTQNLHF